jgi:hypothetical protein
MIFTSLVLAPSGTLWRVFVHPGGQSAGILYGPYTGLRDAEAVAARLRQAFRAEQ